MKILCETELEGRAEQGKPLPCGRDGARYRVLGGIGTVEVSLCDDHLKATIRRGSWDDSPFMEFRHVAR